MDFVHQPYQPGETVAAITTPLGEGGVAIIRISGKEAFAVGNRVFSRSLDALPTHTVHYGSIKNATGSKVDDVLLVLMRGPRSYTGEDTIEINCHGGALITRRVLETVLAAGARAARPGEFTFKAFMNGKIDLAQAEAVQELIAAKNEYALDAAESQLQGGLSTRILSFQKQLTHVAAILEAWVDFPEEGLEFATMDEICLDLDTIREKMEELISSFHDGRILHEGLTLCLVGLPNVGKSSLMNTLLDKERAIVSHIPGTTRDIVEDHLRLNGLNFKLMDTAGIRHAEDIVEQEGIRRSRQAFAQADLVLLLLDASRGLHPEEEILIAEMPPGKTIAVWNKTDLPHDEFPSIHLPHVVSISAKTREGLTELKKTVDSVVWEKGPPSKDELVITNVRHKEALQNAVEACQRLVEGLRTEISPEFLTLEIRQALSSLGSIIGTNISEDILTAIFSTFCIGK